MILSTFPSVAFRLDFILSTLHGATFENTLEVSLSSLNQWELLGIDKLILDPFFLMLSDGTLGGDLYREIDRQKNTTRRKPQGTAEAEVTLMHTEKNAVFG